MLLWLAAITLGGWLFAALTVGVGMRSLRRLAALPLPSGAPPSVSVVIAARDEVVGIEAALRSVLALDYVGLEVIVVDDRSTDGTGALLDRMAAQHPRLRVIHNAAVPAGWLGKNHVQQLGALQASGELLLFSDADIVFEPTSLARAVAYLAAQGLDLVAVPPQVHLRGFWARAFFTQFALNFSIAMRPWRARKAGTREAVGIGAFNLVRASAYHAIGGHARLAMRPDDDMKLALTLKRAGFSQDVVLGDGMISVEWYPDLPSMIRGLEKNSFALFDYSLLKHLAALALHQLMNVWPWIALLMTRGWTWWLNAAAVLVMLIAWAVNQPPSERRLAFAAVYPLTALLFAYTILRSAVVTLRQGGIRWRDTFYPLDQLRGGAG